MKSKDEIMDIIIDEDVEFIRLQFTDIFGNLKNLAITPSQLSRAINNQFCVEGSAIFGGKSVKQELFLHPDLDTFVVLPWRPQQGKVAKVICDIYNEDGTPFEMGPRYILRKTLKEAEEKGYTFMVNPENEFFLFHTDEDGNPTLITHERAGYLDVGPIDKGENVRRDIVFTLEEMGFEIEASSHQGAPGQNEIVFKQAEALESADLITTFRFAVRSIAKRFGLYATFMPKPITTEAGSGMHINISMLKDGVNVFDSSDNHNPTDDAKYFMGGIMKHARALTTITNPIINSYKRFNSGLGAPRKINWVTSGNEGLLKYRNRFGEKKIEVRFPDSSCNPYLAFAAIISAGLDGIENKINPGDEDFECIVTENDNVLPKSLMDSVKEFKNDEFMISLFGEKFVKLYSETIEEFCSDYLCQVTDWEIKTYLNRI